MKYDLCITCNNIEGYYDKLNDVNNKSGFINCYKKPEGYYLDLTKKKYIPCYHSCKFCASLKSNKTNHYCTSCNDKNSYSILDENNPPYMNCYPECKYNYYFNKSDHDNYTCTNTPECLQSYPLLKEKTKECMQECKKDFNYTYYEFRHTCFSKCPHDSKEYWNSTKAYCNAICPFEKPFEMVKTQYCVSNCTIMERYKKLCITNYNGERIKEVQDMILNDFKNDIIGPFNYSFITKEQSLIYEEKNIIYEITLTQTTQNNPKTTTIDLDECENILKKFYNINSKESLYIFKVDVYVEGKTGPKVEYEVYYPINENNLQLLDLTICEGREIYIGYPLNISKEELDLYNIISDYFNDICYTYANSKGADLTLSDRRNDYINNNKSLCDENCKFNGYDNDKKRLICSCTVKYVFSTISDIKADKNKLYKFLNLKQIGNFNVLKCTNLLLSFKGLKTNIGFYSFIPTVILYFTSLILLCSIEFKKIKQDINEIISVKKIYKISIQKNEAKKKNRETQFFSNFLKKKRIFLLTIQEEKTIQSNNKEMEDNDNKTKKNEISTKNKKKYKHENTNDSSSNSKKEKYLNKSNDDDHMDDNSPKKDNKISDKKTETLICSPPIKGLKNIKIKKKKIQFKKEENEQHNNISDKKDN